MAVGETTDPNSASASAEPPPAVTMRQLTFGALVSQAISVIARFGVADTLATGLRQVDDIAGLVGAHGPALYRLLRTG